MNDTKTDFEIFKYVEFFVFVYPAPYTTMADNSHMSNPVSNIAVKYLRYMITDRKQIAIL